MSLKICLYEDAIQEIKKMYKNLPCLKCPVLPMCKGRTKVECTLLMKHITDDTTSISKSQYFQVLKVIKEVFPKLIIIKSTQGKRTTLINFNNYYKGLKPDKLVMRRINNV